MLQELFPSKDSEALEALTKAARDAGSNGGGNAIKVSAVLTPVSTLICTVA